MCLSCFICVACALLGVVANGGVFGWCVLSGKGGAYVLLWFWVLELLCVGGFIIRFYFRCSLGFCFTDERVCILIKT